jgi:hypothetical protein
VCNLIGGGSLHEMQSGGRRAACESQGSRAPGLQQALGLEEALGESIEPTRNSRV